MRTQVYWVTLLVIGVLYGCGSPEYLEEKELSTYISNENHGLSKSVLVNDIQVKVTYRPTDMIVAQELGSLSNTSQDRIDELRKRYQDHYYFIVSLSKAGKEILSTAQADPASFSELLQIISFRMGEKVNLTTANDTIAVSDYIYNRTFGMGGTTDILFVFDKSEIKEQQFFQFNIEEFGLGIKRQVFHFDVDDLEGAPKIFRP